ncbi:MAG: class I SAM-dependent RNA methyltransferase [Hyphomicrobiaceae bacterium]|nr:class I SAM-dependent RNA methyltransferase [Hyphomicrobiaceae bacterium]
MTASADPEIAEIDVTGLTSRGEGVGRIGGAATFVPGALPDERWKVRVAGEVVEPLACLDESPDRIAPHCQHFGTCGGCAVQHLKADPYLAWKRDIVVRALEKVGLKPEVEMPVDAHGAGRRRTVLHARPEGAGYAKAHSHELCLIEACPLLVPQLAGAPEIATDFARLTGPADMAFTASDTGIDLDIRCRKGTGADFSALARRHDLARVSVNGEVRIARRPVVVRMGRAEVTLPPASFLQPTAAGEAALAQLVIERLGKARRVADLFSGGGPFSLRMAETAAVFAADSDQAAIGALDKALQQTPGLKRIGAEVIDLFRLPLLPRELEKYNAAVIDPPRAGARAQCEAAAKSKLGRLVYVSCDPGTFARDARILVDGGYSLGTVSPVDQFRHSAHVELVAAFTR